MNDATPGSDPSAADYLAIGASTASGLGTNSLSLLNSVIGFKDASSVNTVPAIETLAGIVSRLAVVASGGIASPALSAADFNTLGISGVDTSNLSAVLAAVAQTADDTTGVADRTLLQTVVNSVAGSAKPIENWRQTHFGTKLNSGNAENLANPAGDSVPNLIKYGLVLDPSERAQLPAPQMQTNRLKLSFKRDSARTDVRLVVEGSNDLVNWTVIATSSSGNAFTGNATVGETDTTGGVKQVEVSDTVDTTTTPRRFLRIRTLLE